MTTETEDLLSLSDFSWQRLRDRIAGLTDAEYLWEPAGTAWSLRHDAAGVWHADRTEPAPDPAPLTTIAWRLSHIADDVLADGRNATWLGLSVQPPPASEGRAATAAAIQDRLATAYAYWRECLESATDLDDPMGSAAGPYADSSRRSFLLHELDELIHHGAEVGVLRDLYRSRS